MTARDFDYFILASAFRGFRYREIGAALGYQPAAIGTRMLAWRHRYGVKTNRALWEILFT